VIIGDPGVSQLRLSGVSQPATFDTFVDTVTHYLPVDRRGGVGGGVRLNRRDKF